MTEKTSVKKVLLINPPGKVFIRPDGVLSERKHCTPPLGIAYLAANLLRAGYETEVLDILAEGYENEIIEDSSLIYGLDIDETLERVACAKPDLIGISVLFSNRADVAYRIIAEIKRLHPEVFIVLGGQHPSSTPLLCMEQQAVDFVISGEADHGLVELADALNGLRPLESIKGLHYRDGRGVVHDTMKDVAAVHEGHGYKYYARKDAPIPLELDEVPFPAWHLFPMQTYWDSAVRVGGGDIMRNRFAVMMSTRGCPHTCYFCTSPLLSGYKAYRRRTNEDVIREIRWLRDEMDIEEIQFLDDNFFVSAPRVKKLCRLLIEHFPDMIFSVPAGTEVNALDEEMIELLGAANFHKITLAIEAGDQDVQDAVIDKRVNLMRLPDIVRKIHEHKMTVHALMMVGFPGETVEQIDKTVDLAKSLDVDDFYISIVTPLPGTPLYDECIENDILADDFDVDNLRYSYSNIKLPEITANALETIRREAWLEMKKSAKKAVGTKTKGAFIEFSDPSAYENAGRGTS